MIHRNVSIAKDCDNVTVAEFGDGSIMLAGTATTAKPSTGILAMKDIQLKLPISQEISGTSNWSLESFKPDVLLTFSTIESIDSAINTLKKCRAMMVNANKK